MDLYLRAGELEKEFDHIIKKILMTEITQKQIEELAREWAEHTIKVYEKQGVKYERGQALRDLYAKNLEKIRNMRERMGLENP